MTTRAPYLFFFHASADLYGSDYVLLELVKAASRTYRTVVFLPRTGPLVDELATCGDVEVVITELAVLRREYFTPRGFFTFVANLFRSVRLVCAKQKGLDVVAFHTNTSAMWTGCFAALVAGKPHFWQVMEIIESPRSVSWIMSRVVGSFSQRVFCISDAVRTHFLRNNKGKEGKFVTLYHGVDRTTYDRDRIDRNLVRGLLNLSDDTVLVGFAGRYNAWKGQEVLAAAAGQVLAGLDPGQKAHFLFLGSVYGGQHQYETELRGALDASELLKANSTMLGFQKDFENWLGAMDILVLPSKLPEPNATVTIAAMTLGIPMVGTNIGGTVESVVDGQTGFLVPPNDAAALAEKIAVLVKSGDLRREFGRNALKRADDLFSVDGYTAKVLASYQEDRP